MVELVSLSRPFVRAPGTLHAGDISTRGIVYVRINVSVRTMQVNTIMIIFKVLVINIQVIIII